MHDAKVVFRGVQFFTGLLQGQLCALRLGRGQHTACQQVGVAVVVRLGIVQGDLCASQSRLGIAQCRHIGHNHHFRQDVSCLHHIPRFHQHPTHDARNLRLDEDFLPRLNASRSQSLQHDVRHPWAFRVVGGHSLLFLVTQVLDRVQRPSKDEQDSDEQSDGFSVFHGAGSGKLGSKGFNRLDAQRAKGRQNAGKCAEDCHRGQGGQQHVQSDVRMPENPVVFCVGQEGVEGLKGKHPKNSPRPSPPTP